MIKFMKRHKDAIIPKRQTEGAAGFDIHYDGKSRMLKRGHGYTFSTGISMSIPHNTVAFIKPRSGWAAKHKIDVLGGVIDSDYTGEIKVILMNHGHSDHFIHTGDRIAQIVVLEIETRAIEVDRIDDTGRGEDGFGSTGV